jgi:hypothetical protein
MLHNPRFWASLMIIAEANQRFCLTIKVVGQES